MRVSKKLVAWPGTLAFQEV